MRLIIRQIVLVAVALCGACSRGSAQDSTPVASASAEVVPAAPTVPASAVTAPPPAAPVGPHVLSPAEVTRGEEAASVMCKALSGGEPCSVGAPGAGGLFVGKSVRNHAWSVMLSPHQDFASDLATSMCDGKPKGRCKGFAHRYFTFILTGEPSAIRTVSEVDDVVMGTADTYFAP